MDIYIVAAVLGGTVLAFQFLLIFLGWGDDGADVTVDGAADAAATGHVATDGQATWQEAADADLGHPGGHWFYEVLSLRTLSAGVTFFGLGGKAALGFGYPPIGSFVVACAAGLAALYGMYWLFMQAYRMQHAGNENIRNAVGAIATVYVPIPGKRAGAGKVTFRMQNRLVEYQAVTDDDERLPTGEKVVVVALVNSDTLRVSRAETRVADTPPLVDTAHNV